jgi:polyisoprenoid-binding protein YceI
MKKSTFKWKGTKVTGMHEGNISLKSADLKMDNNRIKSGKLVVDMNSITVTDITNQEYAKKFLAHMLNEDFFETNKFPTATLEIVRDTGKALEGMMTIKGKTNRVMIPYTKNGNMYKGTLKFDRTKYGIKYGSGSFFKGLGDKMIHDEVTLNFNVAVK